MLVRENLPNCRLHYSGNFEFRGVIYTLGWGIFSDGRVAELFIDCEKVTSAMSEDARDAAVTLSIALQYGVPLDVIRSALVEFEPGRPAGIIGAALDALAGLRGEPEEPVTSPAPTAPNAPAGAAGAAEVVA